MNMKINIGFGWLLQIVFIVLKLCHIIDWQWPWVLAPTWIVIGFVIVILLLAVILGVIGVLGLFLTGIIDQ